MQSTPVLIKSEVDTTSPRRVLINRIKLQTKVKTFVVCKALNSRKVHLDKFLASNTGSREVRQRLQAFFSSLEAINKAETYTTTSKVKHSYEIQGITPSGKLVVAHIRDEEFQTKNRKLFLISCFWK